MFNVESLNIKNNMIETKAAMKIDSGIKKLFKITLEDGSEVIASRDHIFFTKVDEKFIEKRLCDLKVGENLICK